MVKYKNLTRKNLTSDFYAHELLPWSPWPRSFVSFMGTFLIILASPRWLVAASVNSSELVRNVKRMSEFLSEGFCRRHFRYSSNGRFFCCSTSRPLPEKSFGLGGSLASSNSDMGWKAVSFASRL